MFTKNTSKRMNTFQHQKELPEKFTNWWKFSYASVDGAELERKSVRKENDTIQHKHDLHRCTVAQCILM